MSLATRALAALFALGTLAVLPWVGSQAGPDPAGSGYDSANRLYAGTLALLLALLVLLARRTRGVAAWLGVAAATATCAGVVLEFWIGPLQDRPLSEDAHRAGLPASAVWWGSDAGFGLFAIGALVLAVVTIVWGVLAIRRGTLPVPVGVVLAGTGPLVVVGFALTDYGVAAAVLAGAALGLPWLGSALRPPVVPVAEPVPAG
jgi:hypothetical protein